jgi:hypothetical protein
MFEVIIPGIRHGEAILDTAGVKRGAHCYISGIDSDGYQKLNVPNTTALAGYVKTYPVNKYYFAEDYSDTSDSVDVIAKGASIVYYDGGEYETDQFDAASFGLNAAYWANAELTSATTWGYNPYVPGSSTAQVTLGLKKAYVSTSAIAGTKGILYGSTAYAPTFYSTDGYQAIVLGVHYKDSAHAFIRYRMAYGPNVTKSIV